LDLQIGKDFQILTVSIDPKETTETARKTKQNYVDQVLRQHPNAAEGWEFCTAQQPIITRLADVLGFQYTFDRKTGEYYHPAMLAFLSPDGVISRYSLAVAFEPSDLRKALVEAGDGTVGTPVDQFVLWCFSYDPNSNSYVPQAWKIMRLAGAATVGLMLACLAPYWIGRKRLPGSADDEPAIEPQNH
jgi:protein SCO1/2